MPTHDLKAMALQHDTLMGLSPGATTTEEVSRLSRVAQTPVGGAPPAEPEPMSAPVEPAPRAAALTPLDSLAHRYQEDLKAREDAEWNDVLEAAEARQGQAQPEAPAKPAEPDSPGVLKAGWETAKHATGLPLLYEGFQGAIKDGPNWKSTGDLFEGTVLAAFTYLSAGAFPAAMSLGAMAQEMYQNLDPKARERIVLPGYAARSLRRIFNVPHQIAEGIRAGSWNPTPEEEQALDADMSAGEFLNVLVGIAGVSVGPKLLRRGGPKGEAEPGGGTPTPAPQKALPPARSAERGGTGRGAPAGGPEIPAVGEPRPMPAAEPLAVTQAPGQPPMAWQLRNGQPVLEMEQRISPTGEKAFQLAGVAEELAMDLEAAGGFSYSLQHGKVQFPKGSRAVSIAPEREIAIRGKATAEDISRFIEQNKDVLEDPRAILGAEYLKEADRTNLDISIAADVANAQEVGRMAKQRAVYDPEAGVSEPVSYGQGPHPYNKSTEALRPGDVEAAKLYDAAKTDPNLRPQWEELAAETDRLYTQLAQKIKVEVVDGQPYSSAEQMAKEVKETGVMKVSRDNSEHPFWTPEQNVRFRAVHDMIHVEKGHDFTLRGEERAWLAHAELLGAEGAKTALKTEVYGQAASAVANAEFAPQKAVDLGGTGMAPLAERLGLGMDLTPPKPGARKPARFKGVQETGEPGKPGINLYDLVEDVKDPSGRVLHPAGSTVSEATLQKFGIPGEGGAKRFSPTSQGAGVSTNVRAAYEQLLTSDTLLAEFRKDFKARVDQIVKDLGTDLAGEAGAVGAGVLRTREFRKLYKSAIILGALEIHRGARNFKDFSARMVEATGEFIKPELRRLYDESKKLLAARIKQAKGGLPSVTKLEELQKAGEDGGVWYHGVMEELEAQFAKDAPLVRKFIAATSPLQDVSRNVDLALEAYSAYRTHEGFSGISFGVATPNTRANLKRVVEWWEKGADPSVEPLSGMKVVPFDRAMAGDVNAFVADRWIWRLFYGKELGSPAQYEFMKSFAQQEAARLGVSTRDFQAQLWVATKAATEQANRGAAAGAGRSTRGTLEPLRDVIRRKLEAPIIEDPLIESVGEMALDAAGKVDLATALTLARAAVGAVTGSFVGDTPEERFQNAIVGAFGLAVAPALIRPLVRGAGTKQAQSRVDQLRQDPARAKARLEQTPYQPNYNYIKADPEIKAAMKMSYKLAHDRIEAGRKGVQAHDQTQAMADRLITSGDMTIEKILDAAATAEPRPAHELLAMRNLEVGVADYVTAVKDRVVAGNAIPGELRQAIALSVAMAERVSLAKTGTARALESLKIMSEAETGRISPETVARFADGIDPRLSEMELARALDVAERVAGKAGKKGFLGMVGNFPEAFMELFYGSILWSKALGRNVVGNLTLELATEPVQALASFMPKGIPFVTKGEGWLKPGITMGEAGAQLHGRIEGWRKMAIARAQLAKLEEAGGGKFDLMAERKQAIRVEDPTNVFGHALNYVGTGLRGATQILQWQDIIAKSHQINARVHGMAHRKALTEGLTGEAFQRRYMELVDDVSKFSQSERAEIARVVRQDTYTMEIENPLVKGVMDTIARHESGNASFRFLVLAFPRITSNMFETFASYTPGLNILSTRYWRAMRAGGPEAQRAHAQLALGTAMLGTLLYYADEGLIQGDHAEDPAKRRSFRFPGTDAWVSFRGLGFLEDILAFAADSRSAIALLPEKDLPKVLLASALSMWDAFDNMAFIQTFGEFANILAPLNRPEARVEKLKEFGEKKLLSLVPFSGALRELRRTTDSTRREAKGFMQRLFDGVPGLSTLKDEHWNALVPPRRDLIYGTEEKVTNIPFVTTATAGKGDDPIWSQIYRLTRDVGVKIVRPLPDHVIPGLTEDDLQLAPTPGGKHGFALTHQEKDRLAVIMTQELRPGGRLMHQRMKELIDSTRYETASDPWRADQLSDIYNQYLKGALDQLMSDSPALRQESLRVRGENEINFLPPDRQPAARAALRNRIRISP